MGMGDEPMFSDWNANGYQIDCCPHPQYQEQGLRLLAAARANSSTCTKHVKDQRGGKTEFVCIHMFD